MISYFTATMLVQWTPLSCTQSAVCSKGAMRHFQGRCSAMWALVLASMSLSRWSSLPSLCFVTIGMNTSIIVTINNNNNNIRSSRCRLGPTSLIYTCLAVALSLLKWKPSLSCSRLGRDLS